ncbi:ESF1 homolog [Atheta coriaria]|uniref:ESF1 homolog n=1 Tax=Dalotia coriaria TaxID=877792 RepID=UPI0031F3ADFD
MEADKRFAHVANDPKFRRIPKGERKVKIDKRFQSMFKDKKFKVKYTVDKRGRPVNHSTTENLKRYYDIDSDDDDEKDNEDSNQEESEEESEEGTNEDKEQDDEEDDEEEEEEEKEVQQDDKKLKNKLNKEKQKKVKEPTLDSSDKNVSDQIKKKLKNLTVDYARGEGNLLSGESSSDDEETDDDVQALEEDDGIDHKWGELDADAGSTEEATYRLAACNMDWDRIKANDLMVLFNSFLPPGGSISSIIIYPSEFGKKRLAEEEIKGPAELVQSNEDNENENEEGSKYHMEKLRQYQLNRLKYYYAVVTCDSANSANKIYTECDGMEYESSATKIDLRFIPDDMEFDDEPKEVCDKLPEMSKYKPRFFTTTALQQAKVDLTWDETNPDRVEIAEKLASGKIDDIADADLQAYLASSSGEESENEETNDINDNSDDENNDAPASKKKMIDKYKMLLQEIEVKEKAKEKKDIGMEISWGVDLQKKTEEIIKEKKAAAENKTPFEQLMDKRKEKRKEKREARKNAQSGDKDDDESDVPSDIDMNDPYFAEEFNTPEFQQKKKKTKSKTKEIDSDYDSESESETAERKAQLELLLNDEDEGKKHFSLKKIQDNENESKSKKKRKNKKPTTDVNETKDDFQVNTNDERFSALFTSHHYNIDPTDPHYKKTKNMDILISEKIKRRAEIEDGDSTITKNPKKKKLNDDSKAKKGNAELNVLVKSVKRKAEAFKNKKK